MEQVYKQWKNEKKPVVMEYVTWKGKTRKDFTKLQAPSQGLELYKLVKVDIYPRRWQTITLLRVL